MRTTLSVLNSDYFCDITNKLNVSVLWKDQYSTYMGCNNLFLSHLHIKHFNEILGLTDYDMPWEKSDIESYILDDTHVVSTGKSKLNYQEPQTNTSLNSKRMLRTSKYPVFSNNHSVIGLIVFCSDISGQIFFETALTKREMDCFKLIIKGLSSKNIASMFNLSKRTVESHIESIKVKLNISRKSDLIELANEKGFYSDSSRVL